MATGSVLLLLLDYAIFRSWFVKAGVYSERDMLLLFINRKGRGSVFWRKMQ